MARVLQPGNYEKSNVTLFSLTILKEQTTLHPLFSEELTRICQWVVFCVACEVVSVFGVGTNIVNIICFVKQGFKEPVNVSFLGTVHIFIRKLKH